MNPKRQIQIYTTFYDIFNMSSYRKAELQNDLPKTPKSSESAKNSGY